MVEVNTHAWVATASIARYVIAALHPGSVTLPDSRRCAFCSRRVLWLGRLKGALREASHAVQRPRHQNQLKGVHPVTSILSILAVTCIESILFS